MLGSLELTLAAIQLTLKLMDSSVLVCLNGGFVLLKSAELLHLCFRTSSFASYSEQVGCIPFLSGDCGRVMDNLKDFRVDRNVEIASISDFDVTGFYSLSNKVTEWLPDVREANVYDPLRTVLRVQVSQLKQCMAK